MQHPRPAALLARALRRLGYATGAPPQLTADSKAIDRRVCRRLVCPGCRQRGMAYRPLHRGPQYAALAVCRRCGAGEEL